MKVFRLLLSALVLAVLSTGCASQHAALVSAWPNPAFSPTPADKIAMTLRPKPTAEDAELGRRLNAELQREGFHLVPMAEADYLLACTVEGKWVVDRQSPPTVAPTDASTNPPAAAGQPGLFHSRSIRLYLYNNPQKHPGGLQVAWQGYITAGTADSADLEMALIRTLLGYFGREQHGSVFLAD